MATTPIIYPETNYQTQVIPEALSDNTLIYVAWHPEIHGVRAQGTTPEEAERSLAEVFLFYQEHCIEFGINMPEPQHIGVKQIIWRTIPTTQPQAAPTSPQILPMSVGIIRPLQNVQEVLPQSRQHKR